MKQKTGNVTDGGASVDMSELGKPDRTFFDEGVETDRGAERDDMALGPTYGMTCVPSMTSSSP